MHKLKKHIVIRADGGTTTGMGHIIRSLALADMLKAHFNITFAVQEPKPYVRELIERTADKVIELPATTDYQEDLQRFIPHLSSQDVVILDGYHFKTFYQQTIKDKNCKLVCIDDLHAWPQVADVIINHAANMNAEKYEAEVYTTFCLGLNYALLRKEFLDDTRPLKNVSALRKIFISMGAADMENVTKKIIQALLPLQSVNELHIMLSSLNPHSAELEKIAAVEKNKTVVTYYNITAQQLSDLLYDCDACICPASSISLEACAVGTILISGYTANNQQEILNGLIRNQAAINWGDLNEIDIASIRDKFNELQNNSNVFRTMVHHQKKMIDGKSPQRFLHVFETLAAEQLHFRYASEADTELYFNWSNDVLVRENSFNQDVIAYENHVKWFLSKLQSPACHFYLFFNADNKPVGQVRIDKPSDEVVIGVSIDSDFRGMSYGAEMLCSATRAYFRKYPEATIIAYIKITNTASCRIFAKAGFTDMQQVMMNGEPSYKMYKTLSGNEYN